MTTPEIIDGKVTLDIRDPQARPALQDYADRMHGSHPEFSQRIYDAIRDQGVQAKVAAEKRAADAEKKREEKALEDRQAKEKWKAAKRKESYAIREVQIVAEKAEAERQAVKRRAEAEEQNAKEKALAEAKARAEKELADRAAAAKAVGVPKPKKAE